MSYGTATGVSNNLSDYTELNDAGTISVEMVAECRTAADGIIDAKIAAVVSAATLPLAAPPAVVDNISDDLTTYFILRRVFTGKDPNDSEWVDKFYVRPLELLDSLLENPQIIEEAQGDTPLDDNVASTTEDHDRVFSVTRTAGGAPAADSGTGTMDDW